MLAERVVRIVRLVLIVATIANPVRSGAARHVEPEFRARVVGVSDGDTVTVVTSDRRRMRIRLAEIDAPESGQPFGTRAKQELSGLVFGRVVVVSPRDEDRYGRLVARMRTGGVDAASAMVRQGAAWVYVRYATDRALPPLERAARSAGLGLWALPPAQRVPPWDWRREVRKGSERLVAGMPAGSRSFRPSSVGPACSAKRFCGEMASCAEAVYHLRICHQVRLDADRDGKPCERLCG